MSKKNTLFKTLSIVRPGAMVLIPSKVPAEVVESSGLMSSSKEPENTKAGLN